MDEQDFSLGLECLMADDFDQAIRHFRSYISANPDDGNAYYNLGRAYHSLSMFEEAANCFSKCVDLDGSYDAHLSLGCALRDLGRLTEAIFHERRSLEINSHSANAYLFLGMFLREAGLLQEAHEAISAGLDQFPDHSRLLSEKDKVTAVLALLKGGQQS